MLEMSCCSYFLLDLSLIVLSNGTHCLMSLPDTGDKLLDKIGKEEWGINDPMLPLLLHEVSHLYHCGPASVALYYLFNALLQVMSLPDNHIKLVKYSKKYSTFINVLLSLHQNIHSTEC